MSAEIRAIRLCREPLKENAFIKEENNNEQQYYFATDYFDVLTTEEKKLGDTFCSIMNLEDSVSNRDWTPVQSFTLYFSEAMYQKYEENNICVHRKNPFCKAEEMNFLSIIQVHITPEALRRMQYEDDLCKNEKILFWKSS